jgi:hypothetical protein
LHDHLRLSRVHAARITISCLMEVLHDLCIVQ